MMLVATKLKFLEKFQAIAWKKLSRKNRCYHIAFIFKKNRILSIGLNSKKTHPKIKEYGYEDFSRLHAELSACIRFGQNDCKKYSIAVLRIDRNGKLNQSKPCDCCSNVIRQLKFKKVYFTNSKGEWELYENN